LATHCFVTSSISRRRDSLRPSQCAVFSVISVLTSRSWLETCALKHDQARVRQSSPPLPRNQSAPFSVRTCTWTTASLAPQLLVPKTQSAFRYPASGRQSCASFAFPRCPLSCQRIRRGWGNREVAVTYGIVVLHRYFEKLVRAAPQSGDRILLRFLHGSRSLLLLDALQRRQHLWQG
jgi:hypothetical protein